VSGYFTPASGLAKLHEKFSSNYACVGWLLYAAPKEAQVEI